MSKSTIIALALMLFSFGSTAQPQGFRLPKTPEDPYFKMSEVSCTSQGKTLYGEMYTPVNGLTKKPVIIMAHGFNGTHIVFYDLIQRLSREGFITYAFDFSGGSVRSRSEGSTLDMTIFSERDNLLDVIDQVRGMNGVDPDKIYLLGESQGGLVAAMAAAKAPEKVQAIALMYPAFSIPSSGDKLFPDHEVPDTVTTMGVSLGAEFYKSMFGYDLWKDISKYEKPVLITHGTADALVSIEFAEKAVKEYKDVEYHSIEGGDHGYNNPEHRAQNNQFVVDFFNNQLKTVEDQIPCLTSPAHQLPVLPDEFKQEAEHQGEVVRLDYGDKYLKVYLPYGYDQKDKKTKYNVFYLFHGGNGNPEHYWMWRNPSLKNILDNMIEKGLLEPLIVVTPTYYPAGSVSGGADVVRDFKDEFLNEIIPLVEGKFNTYSKNTKPKALKAARTHRAIGGFSLGSACTWWAFVQSLDYFKWFMPMSGDCWALRDSGGDAEATVKFLVENLKNFPEEVADDYFVYSMTGDRDIAYAPVLSQMAVMQKYPEFRFDDDFSKGNMYFSVMHTGFHSFEYINQYIYYALPYFFK